LWNSAIKNSLKVKRKFTNQLCKRHILGTSSTVLLLYSTTTLLLWTLWTKKVHISTHYIYPDHMWTFKVHTAAKLWSREQKSSHMVIIQLKNECEIFILTICELFCSHHILGTYSRQTVVYTGMCSVYAHAAYILYICCCNVDFNCPKLTFRNSRDTSIFKYLFCCQTLLPHIDWYRKCLV